MTELGLIGWALVVVAFDLRQRRLPNILTLGGLVVGLGMSVSAYHTFPDAMQPAAWQALGLAVLLTLPAYAFGLLGAGDVKLAAAIASLTGLTLFVAVYASAVFLTVSVLVLLRFIACTRYGYLMYSGVIQGFFGPRVESRRTVPFGAALGAALVFVMLGRLVKFHG